MSRRVDSRYPKYVELGHFRLLFCGGQLQNKE